MKHAHKAPVAFALLFPCERLSFGENDIASRVRLETDLDARRCAVVFSSAKSYGNISTVVVLKLQFSGPVWMKGGSVPEMYLFIFFFNNYAYCPNTLGRLCVCILSNHCLLWPTWKKKKNVASRRVSWTHFPVVFFCCCFFFPPSFILHEICALDFSSVLRCKLKRSPDVLQTVRNIWG